MKKTPRSLFGFLLVLSLLFGSCSLKSESESTDQATLRLQYSEWPPDMMAYLAQELGYFEKNGVDVELVWVDGYESAQAIRSSGGIDVWNYTLLDFISERVEGVEEEMQVILLEDYSSGADAVVTLEGNGIDSVTDLVGKKVGLEKGTIGEFFLNILLEREGLHLDDLTSVDMGFDAIPDALFSKEIDAGVTYEPAISEVVSRGGRVLVDSSTEQGVIVDVYVAKTAHVAAHEEAYRSLVKSILEAGEYFNENPEAAAEIIKDPLGMDTEEVLSTFELLTIPSLRENKDAFNRVSSYASLYNLARQAMKYLEDTGVVFESFDLDPLFNSDLVDSL